MAGEGKKQSMQSVGGVMGEHRTICWCQNTSRGHIFHVLSPLLLWHNLFPAPCLYKTHIRVEHKPGWEKSNNNNEKIFKMPIVICWYLKDQICFKSNLDSPTSVGLFFADIVLANPLLCLRVGCEGVGIRGYREINSNICIIHMETWAYWENKLTMVPLSWLNIQTRTQ